MCNQNSYWKKNPGDMSETMQLQNSLESSADLGRQSRRLMISWPSNSPSNEEMCNKSLWEESRLVYCRQPWLGSDVNTNFHIASPHRTVLLPDRSGWYFRSVTATRPLHPCGVVHGLSPVELLLVCFGIWLENWNFGGSGWIWGKGTEGDWNGPETRSWWSRSRKEKGSVAGLEVSGEVIEGYTTQSDSQQWMQVSKQYGDF